MKKFFIAAFLVWTAFIVQSAPAFAAYSDDQIISTLRTRITRMVNSSNMSEFSWWRHRESDWSFCEANDCYLSTNGMVYTIFLKPGKAMNAAIAITQIDLNSNAFRFLEGYVVSFGNYHTFNKIPESEVATHWRTEAISTEYCKYLREHYNEIQALKNLRKVVYIWKLFFF